MVSAVMKRLLITTGGTAGHVYPAIALAEQLKALRPDIECFFAGGNLGDNRHFKGQEYACYSVSSATFSPRQFWKVPFALGKIGAGLYRSRALIQKYKPDLVVGFGSFYTLPVLLAARLAGIPYILHEANCRPGKVNRLLAAKAEAVGVHFPDTPMKGSVVEVGMPVRFRKGETLRKEALQYFGLEEGPPVILIFGGSQGANSLNRIFASGRKYQVIHLTGKDETALADLYRKAGIPACVKAFETRMDYAWELADAVIGRSGASTVAEIIEFEVPALLIPFPRAAENHQEHNARFISDAIGGGITLPEREMSDVVLTEAVDSLLDRREEMREKIREYKKGINRPDLAQLVTGRLDQA